MRGKLVAKASMGSIKREPKPPVYVRTARKPTEEQKQAVAIFMTKRDLVIKAGAGCGKTSTLVMMAEATKRVGRYLAFNKALVEESKSKFPKNVECSTVHSIAWHAIVKDTNYKERLAGHRVSMPVLAEKLNLTVGKAYERFRGNGSVVLEPRQMAAVVKAAIEKFCQSDDEKPQLSHVPWQKTLSKRSNDQLKKDLLPYVRAYWKDVMKPMGILPYNPACYLKQFELSSPVIKADFIFMDEAQDLSPVMISIVQQQMAQIIWVGDSCQPAGTRVRVVVDRDFSRGCPSVTEERDIEKIKKGDFVVSYDIAGSHLHRRGREVTGISSRGFDGELVVVEAGLESSRYTPDHRCVVKVYDAFADKHLVYVMRKGDSYRIGMTSGRLRSQRQRFGPMMRASAEGADAVWLLAAYESREEAALSEWYLAFKYGVPTLTFAYHGSALMDELQLALFWERIGDNSANATVLLSSFGRDIRFPLWEAGEGSMLVRRAIVTRACNLMNGMRVIVADRACAAYGKELGVQWWKRITVSRQLYRGKVYSMNVDEHQTYVSDNIVTHNCQQIYEFTGAINALPQIKTKRQGKLTMSFRFGQPIADMANEVLELIPGSELRLRGNPNIPSSVGEVKTPTAVLTRSNAAAIEALLASGKKVHVVGGGEDIIFFCWAAADLQDGKKDISHPELSCFKTWAEVGEYADESGDSDLKLKVKLIDRFGARRIAGALRNQPAEDEADVVYSTAHKSKGREWDTVALSKDFITAKVCTCECNVKMHDNDGQGACFKCDDCMMFVARGLTPQEARLLYVAVTRAKLRLDLGSLKFGPDGIELATEEEIGKW